MKLAVIGSRGYRARYKVEARLAHHLHDFGPGQLEIISGGCKDSPDQWAEDWGRRHYLPVWSYRVSAKGYAPILVRPDGSVEELAGWFPTFRACAFYRNGLIVEAGTKVLAFWDGSSNGTADGIEKALGMKPSVSGIIHRDLEVVLP